MTELDTQVLLEAFAKALTAERTSQNLTREELAQRARVSARYISYLETNRYQPKLEPIGQICSGLGLSLSDFTKKIERAYPAERKHQQAE